MLPKVLEQAEESKPYDFMSIRVEVQEDTAVPEYSLTASWLICYRVKGESTIAEASRSSMVEYKQSV